MTQRLGILAGGGEHPRHVVDACLERGQDVFVLAFKGQTDPATVDGVKHSWTKLGALRNAIRTLRDAGVSELVMVGPIKRPSLTELSPDMEMLRFLTRTGALRLGDDRLLHTIMSYLEERGFKLRGVHEIMNDQLANAGVYGRHVPDETDREDIARGADIARALGAVDVGQAVVVQDGIVLGVEAIEGTDALLARCGELKREGPGGVLVKIKKPGQDERADLPTIGVETVANAAKAGLRGIAVEAGGTLIVDPAAVIEAADRSGLFLIGIGPGRREP